MRVMRDAYAPYVLTHSKEGERNGSQIWREIAKMRWKLPHQFNACHTTVRQRRSRCLCVVQTLWRRSNESIWLLSAWQFRLLMQPTSSFRLSAMMRKREGERLDAWLTQVHESGLPELESFAHGVERDKDAVQAGLTLAINNGQVEGHVTRVKLIKRMMYGKAGFALLHKRVFTASRTIQFVSLFSCRFPRQLFGTGRREHRPPVPIGPRVFHRWTPRRTGTRSPVLPHQIPPETRARAFLQ